MKSESEVKYYSLKEIFLPFLFSLAVITIGLLFYCFPSEYLSYQKAQFDVYPCQYALVNDNEVRVLFIEKRLPKNDKVIFAASRDAVKRVFNEEILEPKNLQKETLIENTVTKIHLYSSKSAFTVSVVEMDNTIQSLSITRRLLTNKFDK